MPPEPDGWAWPGGFSVSLLSVAGAPIPEAGTRLTAYTCRRGGSRASTACHEPARRNTAGRGSTCVLAAAAHCPTTVSGIPRESCENPRPCPRSGRLPAFPVGGRHCLPTRRTTAYGGEWPRSAGDIAKHRKKVWPFHRAQPAPVGCHAASRAPHRSAAGSHHSPFRAGSLVVSHNATRSQTGRICSHHCFSREPPLSEANPCSRFCRLRRAASLAEVHTLFVRLTQPNESIPPGTPATCPGNDILGPETMLGDNSCLRKARTYPPRSGYPSTILFRASPRPCFHAGRHAPRQSRSASSASVSIARLPTRTPCLNRPVPLRMAKRSHGKERG